MRKIGRVIGKPLTGATSKKANQLSIEYRRARAKVKQELKKGEMTLAEFRQLVAETQESKIYRYMRVKHLLSALPGVGKTGACRLAKELGLGLENRVGKMGERQWEKLQKKIGR